MVNYNMEKISSSERRILFNGVQGEIVRQRLANELRFKSMSATQLARELNLKNAMSIHRFLGGTTNIPEDIRIMVEEYLEMPQGFLDCATLDPKDYYNLSQLSFIFSKDGQELFQPFINLISDTSVDDKLYTIIKTAVEMQQEINQIKG